MIELRVQIRNHNTDVEWPPRMPGYARGTTTTQSATSISSTRQTLVATVAAAAGARLGIFFSTVY